MSYHIFDYKRRYIRRRVKLIIDQLNAEYDIELKLKKILNNYYSYYIVLLQYKTTELYRTVYYNLPNDFIYYNIMQQMRYNNIICKKLKIEKIGII